LAEPFEETRTRAAKRERRRQWLLLTIAVVFTAGGAAMLAQALRRPEAVEPSQLWMALAILLLFGMCGAIFAYQLRLAQRRAQRQATASGSAPLVARHSLGWHILATLGSLGFAAAGLFMMLSGAGILIGLVGLLAIVVFGGFALIGVWRGARQHWSGAEIRIDEAGISDSRLLPPLMAWSAIELICCRDHFGQRFLDVRLKEPAAHLARQGGLDRRLGRLNQAIGFGAYTLTLTGLDAGEAELLAAIARFKPATLPVLVED
jgi:hypothetical protein